MDEDRKLVGEILSGNKAAFHNLISKHKRLVYHIVSRIIADQSSVEDVCQEVFIKVYQKLSGFGFKSKLSTWIGTIAYNTAINSQRSKKIDVVSGADEAERVMDVSNPSSILEQKELNTLIKQSVAQLPKPYQVMITLYHLDQLSYAEIAQVTELPEGTVKSYIFRGRKMLKDKLKGYYQKQAVK